MSKNRYKQVIENYIKVIFTIYPVVFISRAIESILIFYNYGFKKDVLFSEFIGLGYDLLGASLIITIYFLFYFIMSQVKMQVLRIINISLLFITTLVSFLIIKYFLYQLEPLDIFLYKYSIDEVLFTINTSNSNFFSIFLSFTLITALISVITWRLNKAVFSPTAIKVTYVFVIISIPLFFLTNSLLQNNIDKFSMNKPAYFINKTMQYISNPSTKIKNINPDKFQKLYPDKTFISKEYPLVYEIKRKNELGKLFNSFKVSPNIVILIVEGLNDDFIHEYKGAVLMPFLNKLKDKSLYWDHCLTLGERSFAVVPSVLGGLPYGDLGFTLQDNLPRHLSLVSILNSNDYYTSFYYGQGAWFHRKNRFFKYNDIDLVFDNNDFSEEFDKIIVGEDHFFWGYNDKDLFNQSLKVIDTLNRNKRLDIYFTGTSHSPYIITDDSYYTKKLKDHTTEPYKDFYKTYSKYLKTVLFVDDALEGFFNEYKKREDYENTIFIITGDHPMTELPRANSLKRYHVPLIIFSEKLKEHKIISDVVSHLDISETLLSFMQDYITHIPSISTSLGTQLLPQSKKQTKNIAFMSGNREVIDFLSGNYYLSNEKLYKVDSALGITEEIDELIRIDMSDKLKTFKNASLFVCRNNKIVSSEIYCKALNYKNFYSIIKTDTVDSASKYFSIIKNAEILNTDLIFDYSFNLERDKNSDINIAYQITNSRDSVLLWKIRGTGKDKIVQSHIQIDKLATTDSVLYFKSYLYNKHKSKLNISNIDILLHASKPINHN